MRASTSRLDLKSYDCDCPTCRMWLRREALDRIKPMSRAFNPGEATSCVCKITFRSSIKINPQLCSSSSWKYMSGLRLWAVGREHHQQAVCYSMDCWLRIGPWTEGNKSSEVGMIKLGFAAPIFNNILQLNPGAPSKTHRILWICRDSTYHSVLPTIIYHKYEDIKAISRGYTFSIFQPGIYYVAGPNLQTSRMNAVQRSKLIYVSCAPYNHQHSRK